MDSSLPVLVSRLPDRGALARLVRAALRHEIAQVELASAPRDHVAHTLDLQLAGQPSLALLAEPAGAPRNGHFPLRLRPLHQGQAAQLYALLEAENAGPEIPAVLPKRAIEIGSFPDTEGPAAEDPSMSVSVVFDADEVPPAVAEARAAALEESPADRDEPSFSVSVVFETASAVEEDSFFDSALANFPRADLSDLEATLDDSSDAPFVDGDDDGIVAVPPPPDDEPPLYAAPPLEEGEEEEDEATLVRPQPPVDGRGLPSSSRRPVRLQKPMDIVRPEARDKGEFTPTQDMFITGPALPIDGERALAATPKTGKKQTVTGARRKKSTRRRAIVEPDDDDIDTAALQRAPVEPPPMSTEELIPRADDAAIGRRIAEGKYAIESLIGAGATGAVYRATHRELRRTVAIKLLHPHYQQDPQFMTSFRGEALAASQLDHPNVMRVLDFGQEPDGLVYIVMEYLPGRTLQSLLDEERRLATLRAVEIMIQVCAALSVAHDHGIIHRDIKPDNIMLVPSRNDEGTTFELVKVCDFGIAALQHPRAEDAELAASDHVIAGTPEYMSPEQARGTGTDARSDVYACGICLYELVTGRPPFIGDVPGEILIKQLEETPKAPSQLVKGLDPIIEEIILRAIQKEPKRRHQSARELRVELKELIDPGEGHEVDDQDELSIVENVPVLDDPASGFPGFFISLSSAILRFGRFERGHDEASQAMKELQKQIHTVLRGRSELTFARRDHDGTAAFSLLTGTAEIVELRRLLGSQLMGSFGDPFVEALGKKGIASITLREGIPDLELHYIIEMLLGPLSDDDLRKELLSKPLRFLSVLFVSDVVGRERKLSWKVGLCASRLTRDLCALCNVRGISLKKMREIRDELVGGVARLLTRGDEVRQFIFNADLVDEAVVNLRGFSSFQAAPLVIERVLHESCAETAAILLDDVEGRVAPGRTPIDPDIVAPFLGLFARRLMNERSQRSDAVVAEFHRRGIISEDEMPRDLRESILAQALADTLVHEPSQYLLMLDMMADLGQYEHELTMLEAAMATLARRGEAVALLAVMSTLARHAKGNGRTGPRENAALRTMKAMFDQQRLVPIANALLVGPREQHEAARQVVVLAGSAGAQALYLAREATTTPHARAPFVKVFRELGPAGWALLAQTVPRIELAGDAEIALVEDLLRAMPEHEDVVLGDAVARFLPHPFLRATALAALGPLWGARARKPLVEALEYAEEPARIVAINELRRLRGVDEPVFVILERFLTMRGTSGEELRAAAAACLADVAAPLRTRAVQLLSKAVEGKRGFVAMLRGDDATDESVVVMEAMGRALLTLDRAEGVRALRARLARSEGPMHARLTAILEMA